MASPHLFVNLPSTFPYFLVMQSLHHHHHTPYRFRRRFALSATASFQFPSHRSRVQERWCQSLALPPRTRVKAFDDGDSFGSSDWGNDDGGYVSFASSSDEGESDGEYVLNPVADIDLPAASVTGSNDAVNLTAHRLGMIGRGRKRGRIRYGNFVNFGLVAFLSTLLVFVDWWAWKIVRLPLAPFYLACPFFISAALVSFAGYLSVPLLNDLRVHQVIKKELPINHSKKSATPTMGGLFFIPIGVGVAQFFARSSVEVFGAVVATLAFSAIGLLDDILTLVKKNGSGLSAWIKLSLQAAVGIIFFVWLQTASISSPYSMYTLLKMLIPLPASLGLVYLGKSYIILTSVCFASMGSGVNLTDGLDGLAGGTAALAFIGMSIAVLPICSELGIFGSSMAGACVGFLLHNRHKASIFMGDTGSLALGGALAAMATCTGMFFPLFISSGIFVLEASSVIMQVLYFKTTKRWSGTGHRLLRMAPLHHHLELCGLKEPVIVASAYVISGLLALFAGYVGLISA